MSHKKDTGFVGVIGRNFGKHMKPTFFDVSFNTGQISMWFEANITKHNIETCSFHMILQQKYILYIL